MLGMASTLTRAASNHHGAATRWLCFTSTMCNVVFSVIQQKQALGLKLSLLPVEPSTSMAALLCSALTSPVWLPSHNCPQRRWQASSPCPPCFDVSYRVVHLYTEDNEKKEVCVGTTPSIHPKPSSRTTLLMHIHARFPPWDPSAT